MDHSYWTYIAASCTGTLYIGFTNKSSGGYGSIKQVRLTAFPASIAVSDWCTTKHSIGFSMPSVAKNNSKAGAEKRRLR